MSGKSEPLQIVWPPWQSPDGCGKECKSLIISLHRSDCECQHRRSALLGFDIPVIPIRKFFKYPLIAIVSKQIVDSFSYVREIVLNRNYANVVL